MHHPLWWSQKKLCSFLSFPFPALLHIFMYHTALCCCPNHWQEPPLGLHTTTIILNKKKNITCFCLNIVIEILFYFQFYYYYVSFQIVVLILAFSFIVVLNFREILNLMKILFSTGWWLVVGKKSQKSTTIPENWSIRLYFPPSEASHWMPGWVSKAHWLTVSYSCFPHSLNLFSW